MQQRIIAALLTTGLAVGIAGLAWAGQAKREDAQAESGPVVTHLVLRNHTVTVTAIPDGHRYTVGNTSGETFHAALTETELEERYPRLARLLQPAVASDGPTLMMLAPIEK